MDESQSAGTGLELPNSGLVTGIESSDNLNQTVSTRRTLTRVVQTGVRGAIGEPELSSDQLVAHLNSTLAETDTNRLVARSFSTMHSLRPNHHLRLDLIKAEKWVMGG